VKSRGSPFEYLILLLVKYRDLQSFSKEEVGKVLPVLPWHLQTNKTIPTQTFLDLFWSQNRSHSKTRFLKGVALAGTRKDRGVYDL
jgi:hypothetical protein